MDITVTIPDDGIRILESWLGVGQIQHWLQHAINNKLRRRLDASIIEHTQLNTKKMTELEKIIALENVVLPTRDKRANLESERL